MKKIIVLISVLFFAFQLFSQTLEWRQLPNAPVNDVKHDDCFFINEQTGWVISGQSATGRIFKTVNGGLSWQQQSALNGFYRCVGFADSLKGWIGDLESNRMFQTTNGGTNWNYYSLPSPPFQSGVCGIYVLNSNYVFACGRIEMPAYFYKTTNGGINWTSKSMSAFASVLIDCYFWNKDTGIVAGGIDSPLTVNTKPVILYTTNGGDNWVNVFTGPLTKQWCWKLSFNSALTGYASVESYRFTDTVAYLKTTNRGLNWNYLSFKIDTNSYHHQGILFLPDNLTGWIGGYYAPPVGNGKIYHTTNGGISWAPETWGINVNRFRYLNDSVIYSVGKSVYKYSRYPIGIQPISTEIPQQFILHQNYPNPFNPETKIKFSIPLLRGVSALDGRGVFTSLRIFDALGREIAALVSEELNPGVYEVNWDASNYPSGIYFYKIITGEFTESKKIILVK